jgi:hypothetical protein
MANTFTDLSLPKNSYATFDALTLKQLIKNRLTEGGVYTDQNFEGSNLNAIIDVVALSYHYLLFYLNQTATESLFDQATIYENMNRLVKLIDYKPTGYKTALLSFQAEANGNLPADIYTIKRYSFFAVNGIYYTFPKDVTFTKTTNGVESLQNLYNENLLYQGKMVEYPQQIATGEDFETFTVVVKNNITNTPINIDQDSFGVYVKDITTGKYTEYTQTTSVFLESSESTKYELRLNENEFYEIKFGNGVFGKKLKAGDLVYIYYLQSDGEQGIISANQLNGNGLNFFTSPQFQLIEVDVLNPGLNYLTNSEAANISFTNNLASTSPRQKESVDEIRVNAPKSFYAQNRLISASDFDTFVSKNYSNIVISSKTVNNNSFLYNQMKYFYSLGITRPNQDPRYLLNEVTFGHAGQDNNVFIYMVPRIKTVDENNNQFFLQNSQKNAIISAMNEIKGINLELIPMDPVYTAFTIGLAAPGETLTQEIGDTTYLIIQKSPDTRVNVNQIKNDVNSIFQSYFAPENCELGKFVSLSDLTTKILGVNGVINYSMRRVLDTGSTINSNGLSLLVFNPNYSEVDIQVTSSDIKLPYFKYPFLYNKTLLNKIIVE